MQLAVVLDRYLDETPLPAFDWPTANCCHFVSKWVHVVMKRDPMAGLRTTVSAFDAKRLIVELGGSLEAAWTKCLGIDPIPATFAQVGDVMLVPGDGLSEGVGELVGICAGRSVLCVANTGDVVQIEVSRATKAWRLTDVKC